MFETLIVSAAIIVWTATIMVYNKFRNTAPTESLRAVASPALTASRQYREIEALHDEQDRKLDALQVRLDVIHARLDAML